MKVLRLTQANIYHVILQVMKYVCGESIITQSWGMMQTFSQVFFDNSTVVIK